MKTNLIQNLDLKKTKLMEILKKDILVIYLNVGRNFLVKNILLFAVFNLHKLIVFNQIKINVNYFYNNLCVYISKLYFIM